ncbi:hypothetical protein SMACR_05887 [Sordaria macrospora]|uniref:Uncharacterized protein n=1 Tax=Sordaria macrospora TaxID=5147 RepID=A0A8S8ZIA1_SORMA|nr:hypothetical protein SMACR_05887 [Sordaria macrospora]KAH7627895.1 hypothetical protein B0T09DRAFT_269185 [Sordaria sp. MPI-SDFR-AT-0083]WPJ65353.1 hypothetical protein SMAC4_05887 [Sordaria macrospora]
MDSTIAITQRLNRLDIAADAPSRPGTTDGLNDASASNGSSLPTTTTAGITSPNTANDVDMNDDLITATSNLSLQDRPRDPQSRRHHAEWPRVDNRNWRRTIPNDVHHRQGQASRSPRASPSRARARASRRVREEPNRLFRQHAQIESRQSIRSRQNAHNTHAQSSSRVATAREQHHRNLFISELRIQRQFRIVSAIAASASY